MEKIEKYLNLRRLVDVLYDVQDVRTRTANRLRQMPKDTMEVYVSPLKKVEEQLTREIDGMLQTELIYTEFLDKVKGIGPRISGSIIAQTMIRFDKLSKKEYEDAKKAMAKLNPTPFVRFSESQLRLAQKTERGNYLIPALRGIGAFDTVSKYWAWWGLHTVDGRAAKRRRGGTINWNPKMRMLAWKISKQFVLQGDRYRLIYDRYKKRKTEEIPTPQDCPRYEECKASLKKRKEPACKGHIHNMSKRYAVKEFVKHLYEAWRKLEGLPVREPYSHEYLGHPKKKETKEAKD